VFARGEISRRRLPLETCVLNGKARRPIRLPRCEIVNTTDWDEVIWKDCRFYLSPGEVFNVSRGGLPPARAGK
jgi:hypothetical protein